MDTNYDELNVKELQEVLIGLGMPKEDVETFRARAPLRATIKAFKEKNTATLVPAPATAEPVKKVESITEPRNPSEDKQVNKRWFGKAKIMRDKLMQQLEDDPISIIVPLQPGEKRGVVEWRTNDDGEKYQVRISGSVAMPQENGFIYMIPKGVYYSAPRQIAESIARSEQQTLDAGAHISMDRLDERTGRPMSDFLKS